MAFNIETATKSFDQSEDIFTDIKLPINISKDFIGLILSPFKEDVKYLKSAQILDYFDPSVKSEVAKNIFNLLSIEGRFSISESSLLNNRGDFSMNEFNICYTQLAYVLFGKCIQIGLLQGLLYDWAEKVNITFNAYFKHQPSSLYIVKSESNFLQPLSTMSFRGKLTISRIVCAQQTALVNTKIIFSDAQGIKSEGLVVLEFKIFNSL